MFALAKRLAGFPAAVLERNELSTGCGRCHALGIGCSPRFTKLQQTTAVVSYVSFCGCTLMPQDMLYEPEAPQIKDLISRCGLSAVFQPVVSFESGAICGYEGLIRGPVSTSLEMPHALFAQARAEGCAIELERAAARICLKAFAGSACDGKLLLNFSAEALRRIVVDFDDALNLLKESRIDPSRIVLELTEQSIVDDVRSFMPVIAKLRATGMQLALDDYGTAHASMNLWVGLRPEVVKIDRFFIHGIASDPLKFEAVKAMQHFANASGARLVAEGIDNAEDLRVVRDMGISFGQGFYFGQPSARPLRYVADEVRQSIYSARLRSNL
jgi:EAL domain-containing protein (putative c-di-GMP-specific phosphodiesterase class I)